MKIKSHTIRRTGYQSSWLNCTLESLENDDWGPMPTNESYLITTCHKLRKKKISEFEIEDFRILIGQDIGLKFLIPPAIKILSKNILAEGHFYSGDLLKMVITSDKNYWKIEHLDWKQMIDLVQKNIKLIERESEQFETAQNILDAFHEFKTIRSDSRPNTK